MLLIDNDLNLYVRDFRMEDDDSVITDADFVVHIGDYQIRGTITGATNASPIVLTSANHGRAVGEQIIVSQVNGNLAANGVWTISAVTANTITLTGSAGNGAYENGGVWYLAVDGAVNITLAHQEAEPGTYKATLPATVPLVDGLRYVRITEAGGLGYKTERILLARVRS